MRASCRCSDSPPACGCYTLAGHDKPTLAPLKQGQLTVISISRSASLPLAHRPLRTKRFTRRPALSRCNPSVVLSVRRTASTRHFRREMIRPLDCVTNARLSFRYRRSLRPHPETFSRRSRFVLSVNSRNYGRSTFANPKASLPISRRMTDILLVNIDNWPTGVFADPTTVEGRAAWYSFAFWLRLAAGAHMDVDALELQASFRTLPDPVYSAIGQAFLCDQLENGAGYCRFLADSAEFKQLLQQGDPNTSNSIAAKWTTLTTSAGPVSGHSLECDTSCNLCLRDFHNLPYHGLLDWWLALDMARLAEFPIATIDLTSPWGSTTNPWATIVSAATASAPATLQRLGYSAPVQFGSLRGYVHQNPTRRTVLIERHPLWNDQHPDWSTAYADATAKHPGYKIQDLNPFRLLRRPADYV